MLGHTPALQGLDVLHDEFVRVALDVSKLGDNGARALDGLSGSAILLHANKADPLAQSGRVLDLQDRNGVLLAQSSDQLRVRSFVASCVGGREGEHEHGDKGMLRNGWIPKKYYKK